jgi:nitrogen fixation negative regulator NifL
MATTQPTAAYGEVIDAISRFLAAPPEGTPAELIDAFSLLGNDRFLPPRLFLETVEQAPIAISITDPSARILYANSAFERLTGYAREEVIGHNESMLSSHSTPLSVYQDLWKTIRRKEVWSGALVNHRASGEEYLAELCISPVLSADGSVAYYLGMHRDITAVHRLEQKLKFQKSLTEAALDAAPMVVAMIDGDGRVLLDNHAYKALQGDFRGVEPARLFTEALTAQIGTDLLAACEVGQGFTNVDVRLDPHNGRQPRWFSCSGVRIAELDSGVGSFFRTRGADRCCLLLVANEVTDSRERINQARLNMIRDNLAEQQLVHTMREAMSASIFQFQAPMNIIKAALSMSAGGGDRSGLEPVLSQALRQGEEAIESLHAALPGQALEHRAAVNVNELLHEVLRLSTDALLASGVVVDWRATPVLPTLHGRPNTLRALFKYVIDNAVAALNEAGADFREIRVETRASEAEIVVAVMDNGVGIPDAIRFKVFEPFFCGWEQARGHAGMGLTMAQEIAISHGGSIEIDRDFLGGSRIFIRLPHPGTGED